jgi:hypothetical protein
VYVFEVAREPASTMYHATAAPSSQVNALKVGRRS